MNISSLRILCPLLVAMALLTGCHTDTPQQADLCILYTTDTHGNICPYDFNYDHNSEASLAQFATLVREQRSVYGDRCLVFDNGNKMSGSPTAFYYKFVDTISQPLCFRAERLIDYNAVGIGNDDIEIPEILQPARHDNAQQPPVLCANLIYRETGKPVFNPYAIYDRNGIKVAVLGMTAPSGGEWLPRQLWNSYDTEDMIECARKWIPLIQQHDHPDVIIGLFACSKDYINTANDYDVETYKNPNGGIPAAIKVPGFDLILLGDSGEEYVGHVVNEEGNTVTVVQAGKNCEKAGLVRVHLRKRSDGTYSKQFFSSLIDLRQYVPDPVFSQKVRDPQDSIFLWINKPVTYFKQCLQGNLGLYGPDYHRDLINTALLWHSRADVAIMQVTIPNGTIQPGPILMRHIFDIYPYHHQMQLLDLTGEEIRRLLEWSYACQFETMHTSSDPLLSLVKDPFGHVVYDADGHPTLRYKPTAYISARGIRYQVDISKPAGERVTILSRSNGTEFDLRKTYRVAFNSSCLSDDDKFISKGLNWDSEELALHAVPSDLNSIRKILLDYFTRNDTIDFSDQHDWQVVPTAMWSEARDREERTLDAKW